MVVVESHHHVLEAWAKHRASLSRAPRLVTLDHHTDTSSPFRNTLRSYSQDEAHKLKAEWLANIDYRKPQSVTVAMEKLSHDEHIATAIAANIVSSAFVIAQNAYDTDLDIYREHAIMCLGVDRKAGSNALSRADRDRVLESSFLNEMIAHFDKALSAAGEKALLDEPFILDIDLDYLNTVKSVEPEDARTLKDLARRAGLITVAREEEHVRMCAAELGVTADFLMSRLVELLRV